MSPRQLNQRDNVDRTGYYKSAISNDNANTTIPCWPSMELIQQMSLALETVCAKLAVALVDDPATRLVASKIIELAQRGVRDTPTLIAMTLKEFKHY